MPTTRRAHVLGLLGVASAFPGCRRNQPRVHVGAKSGHVQAFLAEAIGLQLEPVFGRQSVELRPALGGTAVTHESLMASQIDLYPEYSGAALTALLGLASQPDAAVVREQVKANYRIRFRCEWVAPLGFENGPVLLTTAGTAESLQLKDLSGASAVSKPWRLGATREFMGAPDGFSQLMSVYKLPLSGAVQVIERQQLYAALEIGQVTLVAGEALDGGARAPSAAVLRDDRNAFPPYEAGIVVSLEALNREPGLMAALTPLAGRFPFERMARVVDELERAEAARAADPNAPPADLRAMAARFLRAPASDPAK